MTTTIEDAADVLAKSREGLRLAEEMLEDLSSRRSELQRECAADMADVEKLRTLTSLRSQLAEQQEIRDLHVIRVADAESAHANVIRAAKRAELHELDARYHRDAMIEQLRAGYFAPMMIISAEILRLNGWLDDACNDLFRQKCEADALARQAGEKHRVEKISADDIRLAVNVALGQTLGGHEEVPRWSLPITNDAINLGLLLQPLARPDYGVPGGYKKPNPMLNGDYSAFARAEGYVQEMSMLARAARANIALAATTLTDEGESE